MALQDDVGLLVEYGLFNEDALGRIANAIRTVRELAGGGSAPTRRAPARRGRPAGGGGGRKTRAPRGSFNPSKDELSKLKANMTAKAIAEKFGISTATVNNRLRAMGLTKPRKGKK